MDDELITELKMLVARRGDLAGDRTRMINRLRDQLLALCPALERALALTNKGPLILLTRYQRPGEIQQLGADELAAWLKTQKVRGVGALDERAVKAASSQATALPGEEMAALLVSQLAKAVLSLDDALATVDKLIADRFHLHADAKVIESMPGIGPLLGAEFLAATGGDLSLFPSANHLAGYAGLAPTPRDSGRVSGNLHRPRRYNRALNRVFYT